MNFTLMAVVAVTYGISIVLPSAGYLLANKGGVKDHILGSLIIVAGIVLMFVPHVIIARSSWSGVSRADLIIWGGTFQVFLMIIGLFVTHDRFVKETETQPLVA